MNPKKAKIALMDMLSLSNINLLKYEPELVPSLLMGSMPKNRVLCSPFDGLRVTAVTFFTKPSYLKVYNVQPLLQIGLPLPAICKARLFLNYSIC